MTPAINKDEVVAAMRHFNRFYTRQIGLLDETLLQSTFTLTEARVLHELASQDVPRAPTGLGRTLSLDLGYLSRILKGFEERGLVRRMPSTDDRRQTLVVITEAGRTAFEPLNQASEQEINALISHLPQEKRQDLVKAMHIIEELLHAAPVEAPITFRSLRLGDLGWIARRQAIVYAQEYGLDGTFEALVAEILAGFVRHNDPVKERSWIATRDNYVVGSVFVMRASESIAKLRLMYVEPGARGLGLGRRMVDECISFARQQGYRTLTLWTNDVLVPARRIYQAAGFTCTATEPHRSFGKDLVGETWDLAL